MGFFICLVTILQAIQKQQPFLARIQFRQLRFLQLHDEWASLRDELAYSPCDANGTLVAPLNPHQREAE
jgi:hypothetical protein